MERFYMCEISQRNVFVTFPVMQCCVKIPINNDRLVLEK